MRLSVIIPTLNEGERIAGSIARLRAAGECEVIVVDGGSQDETLAAAGAADRCLSAPRGRASQRNIGARAASGGVRLFRPADCWPGPGAVAAIQQALDDDRVIGGGFAQTIEAPGWRFRLRERGNALRVRATGWIYGDQGLFVRRDRFE